MTETQPSPFVGFLSGVVLSALSVMETEKRIGPPSATIPKTGRPSGRDGRDRNGQSL